jgi:hypothetical protein
MLQDRKRRELKPFFSLGKVLPKSIIIELLEPKSEAI